MNILITLPKDLLDKIMSGEKKYEMRKCLPKLMKAGEDGFFIVEKGTDNIRCYCGVKNVIEVTMSQEIAEQYASDLCVTPQFILSYRPVGTKVYLWEIDSVSRFNNVTRKCLGIDNNPQQYVYVKTKEYTFEMICQAVEKFRSRTNLINK